MANVVALLDSMWGWGGYNDAGEEAPRYFRINPDNHSGRRLYALVGEHKLLVTNSCRYVQSHAASHGKPDVEWVRENLVFLAGQEMRLLLVCGLVARTTYAATKLKPKGYVVRHIAHPAARFWTKEMMIITQKEIARICQKSSK